MVLSYCISINYGIFCIIFYLRKKVDYMNNYGMNGWCKEISGGDSISRQAAIDVANAVWATTGDKNVAKVWEMIKDLPPAQPEPKKGKWIEAYDPFNRISGRCSVCGWEAHLYEDDVVGMNYCPNCGARMEGEIE